MQLSLIPEIVATKPMQKLPDRQLMISLFRPIIQPVQSDLFAGKTADLFVFSKD
jgi:hypothetical protein